MSLESNIHITQGQFIKLIGAAANDKLMTFLEANAANFIDTTATDPTAITCRSFLRVINKQTGFDLDNPEFIAAMGFCVQVGAMTQATKDIVIAYVATQTPMAPVVASTNRKRYTLIAPENVNSIPKYTEYVWPYLQFIGDPVVYVTEIGQFELDGSCTNPAAVEVV